MKWHDLKTEPAPIDRPIALLSIQPQLAGAHAEAGGAHVTMDVCEWNGECFEIGYRFRTGIGHSCATHWCEVSDLELPEIIPQVEGTA